MLADIAYDVLGLKRRKLPKPRAKQATGIKASVIVIAKQNTSCFGEIKVVVGTRAPPSKWTVNIGGINSSSIASITKLCP
jgi:hypothetical protein